MTAVLRNDFMYLFLKNSSYLCKSRVPFSNWYSTSTHKKPSIINPKFIDYFLHKHNFTPSAAAEAASVITCLRNPAKSDSLLSFLRENDFSESHFVRILKYCPSFISADLEKSVKPKIKILQEVGLSNKDIADLFARNPSILYRSTVLPALSVLRNLLGSDVNVVKLLKKSGWFLIKDLERNMIPNIQFLKSRSVPMERIIKCVHSYERLLLQKPEIVRKRFEKAEKMGAQPSSRMYIHVVRIIGSYSERAWELKLQSFRNLGFSEEDILNAFNKYPAAFSLSARKMEEVKQILISSGKYDMASIANYPISLACSIENRLKPRLRVIAALERRKLINKWPSLGRLCCVSNKQFFDKFVIPYADQVGHLYVTTKSATSERRSSSSRRKLDHSKL